MLPGKKYKPEDLLSILKRRYWLILVPFAVVSAGAAIVAHYLPDVYSSTAAILLVPQQVPESYVKSAVTSRIEDRLPAIEQEILSRTKLENIIEELNLYQKERRTGIMEDVVEQMRNKDTDIKALKGDAFTVTYQGSDPHTVQKVAERLASLFIQETTQDRTALTDSTSQFLESSLAEARRRLQDQEAKLKDYRIKYSGQLPTQLEGNLQALGNTQAAIRSEEDEVARAAAQKLIIQRQLADLQSDANAATQTAGAVGQGQTDVLKTGTTAQRLQAWKDQLANLQLQQGLSDIHPNVKAAKAMIAELTKQLDTEAMARPVSADPTPVSPVDRARDKKIADYKLEEEFQDKQIAAAQAEIKRLKGISSDYEQRIAQVPNRESELTELMRDYATVTAQYNSLESRKEEADLAASLERRQIGEQFKLLDAARVPEKPISPNRPMLNALGMLIGLAIGLGLVAVTEYRDSSFKTDDEVTRILALPVLAVVPLMQSQPERQKNLRRRLLTECVLATGVLGCLAVLVYAFIKSR